LCDVEQLRYALGSYIGDAIRSAESLVALPSLEIPKYTDNMHGPLHSLATSG
jgi:hypothetical protein